MRVCFLTHYYPPERGAPQVRISALAAQLAKRGHDSVIHTGFPNYPTGVIPAPYRNRLVAQDRDASGRPVVRSLVYATPNAGFTRRVVNHAVFAASAVVTNRSTGPADVVVAETPPLFTAAAGVAYAALKRAPLVLTVSDRWPASAVALEALNDRRAVRAAEQLEAWCYRHASALVAPTERLAGSLHAHPDSPRVVHIPPSVDLHRFVSARASVRSGPLRVLYAGTVGMAQNLETLVEAAALAGPDVVRVRIAGGGAAACDVQRAITRRAATNVELLGPRPASEIPSLYADADAGAVLLHDAALFEEAVPTKLFEAMAARRPILLAARGEAVEIVQAAGCALVVEPGDAGGLADAIRRLAADPDLGGQLGAAGRRWAESHHTREEAAARWDDLLTQVRH